MGFSLAGVAVSVAVLAPNLLLLWLRPRPPLPAVAVSWPIAWLERAGQALCLVVPGITAPGTITWWWLIPAIAALGGYYALWARYLLGDRAGGLLYAPVWSIPVPMAILPVVVFAGTAAWLGNVWIVLAAAVLAAGHIPASAIIAHALSREPGSR